MLLRFLGFFAVKLSVLDHHLQYTCETSFKCTASTYLKMACVSKDGLVFKGGSKQKKRKRDETLTPKAPPKAVHSKMSSALGEELCYQFAWGSYSPQKVQQLAQLAIQDIDVLATASTGPSSATLLAGSSKSHSSATVISGTSSATLLGATLLAGSSSATSSATSSLTSKEPYIELRQLSAMGSCGKHSQNCHRDLMAILEMKSLMPMPEKLSVAMSPSLSF